MIEPFYLWSSLPLSLSSRFAHLTPAVSLLIIALPVGILIPVRLSVSPPGLCVCEVRLSALSVFDKTRLGYCSAFRPSDLRVCDAFGPPALGACNQSVCLLFASVIH